MSSYFVVAVGSGMRVSTFSTLISLLPIELWSKHDI